MMEASECEGPSKPFKYESESAPVGPGPGSDAAIQHSSRIADANPAAQAQLKPDAQTSTAAASGMSPSIPCSPTSSAAAAPLTAADAVTPAPAVAAAAPAPAPAAPAPAAAAAAGAVPTATATNGSSDITTSPGTTTNTTSNAVPAPPAAVVSVIDGGLQQQQHQIRRSLARRNPVAVINEFQLEHELRVPNTHNVMRFLDLLGITRAHTYESLQLKLLHKLLADNKLEKISSQQKMALLEKSFSYIGIEELREIPLQLLSEMDPIPDQYLDQLAAHQVLHETLPNKILRAVWTRHPALFHAKLVPLLASFVNDHARLALYGSLDADAPTAAGSVRESCSERRKHDSVLQLLHSWIGDSPVLYDLVVRTVRDQFASSHHHGYCVLRMELLMTLHDQGQQQLVDEVDQDSHMFAWCLDAAVRESELEGRLLDELRMRYAALKEKDKLREHERSISESQAPPSTADAAAAAAASSADKEQSLRVYLQDLSMIIAHPLVTRVLLRSIWRALSVCVEREQLPKENESLRLLSHVLLLGCSARRLLRPKRHTKLPKSPAGILRSFYPLLCLFRANEPSENEETTQSLCLRLRALFVSDKVGVCRSVVALATVELVRVRDWSRASCLLRILGSLQLPVPANAGWEPSPLSVLDLLAGSLVSALSCDESIRALQQQESFRLAALNDCLLPLAKKSRVYYVQLLTLLIELMQKAPGLDDDYVSHLLQSVQREGQHRSVPDAAAVPTEQTVSSKLGGRDVELRNRVEQLYAKLLNCSDGLKAALSRSEAEASNASGSDAAAATTTEGAVGATTTTTASTSTSAARMEMDVEAAASPAGDDSSDVGPSDAGSQDCPSSRTGEPDPERDVAMNEELDEEEEEEEQEDDTGSTASEGTDSMSGTNMHLDG